MFCHGTQGHHVGPMILSLPASLNISLATIFLKLIITIFLIVTFVTPGILIHTSTSYLVALTNTLTIFEQIAYKAIHKIFWFCPNPPQHDTLYLNSRWATSLPPILESSTLNPHRASLLNANALLDPA